MMIEPYIGYLLILISTLLLCNGQRDSTLPVSITSFRQFERMKATAPEGRFPKLSDLFLRHYGKNSTTSMSYHIGDAKRLLSDINFDLTKPTVVYAHGYIELTTDESVLTIVRAYQEEAGHNILVLDWANLGFGNFIAVALDLKSIGLEASKALSTLLSGGLSLKGLHLVGHSMGAHLLAFAARDLVTRGFTVPRLTGLDPAYPGFYPPLIAQAIGPKDATFVDIIHTDGGGYGAPGSTGQADFWPNEGKAKQPGCVSATVLLTTEDFCSHWRSWAFWAESVVGGQFLARQCDDYDAFLRGQCRDEEAVDMGIRASPKLRGNFYLRTAAKEPFALGERGAE